ncbi:hypothetical protein A6A08_00340 [Nocardiopsis sp. TSRI0078]|uniref:DUF6069 family protein n=1 Tax=unclassified Nocardiopsis TaxID=2649073 RepID=UPI000965FC22|nr:DUF6069 family protein [Nocardiopsis sp. TSRI0078]OKI23295.1 hypothetical protein A6A08_00340 [Nocardiopsis sp. TSRI0078]
MSTPTAAAPPAPAATRRPGAPWWAAGAVSVAAATAANLLLLGLGHLVGASMEHPDGAGGIAAVEAGGVAFMSAVPLAAGFVAAVLLSLLWKGFLRTGQIVGTVLAVASAAMPFLAGTDLATEAVLALMHVVLVPVVWFGLGAVRLRALS